MIKVQRGGLCVLGDLCEMLYDASALAGNCFCDSWMCINPQTQRIFKPIVMEEMISYLLLDFWRVF